MKNIASRFLQNRRQILSVVFMLAALAVLIVGFFLREYQASAEGGSPNIVLIVTDDQRYDTVQYMPQLQALLANAPGGTTFSKGYVTTSLCCPSRSSILTGQYAHNHGVHTNDNGHAVFKSGPEITSTVAIWLQNAGYKTGLLGKYLNQYAPTSTNSYIPPGWDTFEAFVHPPEYYNYKLTNYVDGIKNPVVSYGSAKSDYSTDVISAKAKAFIERANTNDAQPFFLMVAPYGPHLPATSAEDYKGSFSDISAYRPPSFNKQSTGAAWVRNNPALSTSDINKIDKNRKSQLRALLSVDDLVNNVKQTLIDQGELSNTVIFYISDNGFHWGEHRIPGAKKTPYEETHHVPFIVFDGRNTLQARVFDKLALNIDLTPTFLELAGVTIPSSVDGRSLVSLLAGTEANWRTDFLQEGWNLPGVPDDSGKYSSVHDSRWVFTKYATGEKELYDLIADPYQLKNLASNLNYSVQKTTLDTRLTELKNCVGKACW